MPVSRLGRLGGAVLAVVVLGSAPLVARDAWVVRFYTVFPDVIPPCQPLVSWHSHLMFTNTTSQDEHVRVLDASNGTGVRVDARPLGVAAGQTVSVRGVSPPDLHWEPAGRGENEPLLWVNKLAIPDGVLISARGESQIGEPLSSSLEPPCHTRNRYSAGFPLPVITNLIPAGIPQYHLGVDIGDYTNATPHLDARFKVGVFNAGGSSATARIEVRCSAAGADLQSGPDPILATANLTVPANNLIQETVVVSTRAVPCPHAGAANPYHLVVISDRPGFSYALGLTNEELPKFPAILPTTH
jgi:hypothetical protein